MEFIRILSPNSAPPVFFLEGSTEITAIVLSVKLLRYRLAISSVTLLFPAPPVPVIPRTGRCWFFLSVFLILYSLIPFSALVISLAIFLISFTSPVSLPFYSPPFHLKECHIVSSHLRSFLPAPFFFHRQENKF